ARAVGPGGKVWWTDGDPHKSEEAGEYFRRAGVADRIERKVGDAVRSMKEVPGDFDVVFCDIDKSGYPEAFRAAAPRIRPGGLFVCDNTLWSGRVLEAKGDDFTEGVKALHREIAAAKDFWPVTLPLRDGVT